MNFKETEVPVQLCPYCEQRLDKATSINHEQLPSPGDATVCARCTGLLVFNEELKLRKPTDEERVEIELDPMVQQLLRVLTEVNKRYRN